MDSSTEVLLKETFKLNLYEVKVYTALLSQPMAPKEISKASGVPQSRVYDTLGVLSQKGFVEERSGKYTAVSPLSALNSRIAQFKAAFEKEQQAREDSRDRIVRAFKPIYKRSTSTADPVLLKGINSIGSRLIEILSGSKDLIFLVRKGIRIKDTFKLYLESAPLKGKNIKILLPTGTRLDETDRAFAKGLGIDLRSCDNPILDMVVADHSDVIIGVPEQTRDEPFSAIAIWVKNPSFATSTRRALEEIWSASPQC